MTVRGTQAMGTGEIVAEVTRTAPFSDALIAAAQTRPEIVGLSADLATYTDMLGFARRFPDRFVNVGMAEQNLIGVAAGLWRCGFVPVATTYGVFATRRAYDFIAIQCAHPRADVKIVAGLPGLTTGYGATHQGIDDLALMRALPNMTVIDPADATEIVQATAAMLALRGPVYIRLLRGEVPVVLDEATYRFELGRMRLVREGADVVVIACGTMVQRALAAATALEQDGVCVGVCVASTLKPFDNAGVVAQAAEVGAIVTAENHSIVGGLYSAVAESLARSDVRVPVEPVGIRDEFCGFGSLPHLDRVHGLTSSDIQAAARRALERKGRR